jgi:glutaredoxin
VTRDVFVPSPVGGSTDVPQTTGTTMTQVKTTNSLYVKQGCPFCFKLRLYLLEAGVSDKVSVTEFAAGSDTEQEVRAILAPHLETISFPAAQLSSGEFLADSDALVAHFSEQSGVDPATLPTYQAYIEGPFKQLFSLYRENVELKKHLS